MIKKCLALLVTLLSLISCSDIIEPTLEKEKINILAPTDTLSIQYTQTFTWEKVENASYYQIQIASPNFTSAQRIVVDTNNTSNTFKITLSPDRYEFRIRAYNNSSHSDWTYRSLKIDTACLCLQQVLLKSPQNRAVYNIANPLPLGFGLEWDKIPGKNIKYRVLFDSSSTFATASRLGFPQTVTGTLHSVSLTKDATYYWKVKAIVENNGIATDSTDWSDVFLFIYDNTAPQAVNLLSPSSNSSANKATGQLKWSSAGQGVEYKVNIQYGADATVQSSKTTNLFMDYNNTGKTTKDVIWWVDVIDKSGNINNGAGTKWTFTTE